MKRWIGVMLLSAGCGPVDPDTARTQQPDTASAQQAIYTGGEQMPDQGPNDTGGEQTPGQGPITGGEQMPDQGPNYEGDCRPAENRTQLLDALADKHQGWVCIPDGTEINLTGCRDIKIHPGTKLWGERTGTRLGARIFMDQGPRVCTCLDDQCGEDDHNYAMFQIIGDTDPATNGETRIEGLRLHGPYPTHGAASVSLSAIHIDTRRARDVVVKGNEISAFSFAGIRVTGSVDGRVIYPDDCTAPAPDYPCGTPMTRDQAGEILITQNYIHSNVRDSYGYGVTVARGSYAYIQANVFDYNRHAVSHDGAPFSGYIARFNYVLEGGHCEDEGVDCYYNQHFDVHGSAPSGYGGVGGQYFEISSNTIRGEQSYYVIKVRPAFYLRGEPTELAIFSDNVLEHDDADDAVNATDVTDPPAYSVENLEIEGNRYDTDTSNDLAVGDFDGDGRDDVFVATGTAWFYSSAGQTEWRFLKASTLPVERLGFGHFDADGKTDVFWRGASDGAWYYLSGGTGASHRINVSDDPFEQYRFGDFDGDGATDVFTAKGGYWQVSWSGRTTWQNINKSVVGLDALRFGDLDGDGATDVFNIHPDGYWRWSRSAQSTWMALILTPMSTDLGSLAFGNFDGRDGASDIDNADRTTDIAQRDGDGWRYSKGGRTAWSPLRGSGGQPGYADPTRCLIGDFNGDGRDDCLRYQMVVVFPGRYFWWWTEGSDQFVRRSRHPMR